MITVPGPFTLSVVCMTTDAMPSRNPKSPGPLGKVVPAVPGSSRNCKIQGVSSVLAKRLGDVALEDVGADEPAHEEIVMAIFEIELWAMWWPSLSTFEEMPLFARPI